jgi:hypothetical protein
MRDVSRIDMAIWLSLGAIRCAGSYRHTRLSVTNCNLAFFSIRMVPETAIRTYVVQFASFSGFQNCFILFRI